MTGGWHEGLDAEAEGSAVTGTALVRYRDDSVLRELRRCWANGKRVALSLTDQAGRRAEGHVTAVSPTGVTCRIGQTLVPIDEVLAIHRPVVMGEDTTYDARTAWHGPALRVCPQSEELPGIAA